MWVTFYKDLNMRKAVCDLAMTAVFLWLGHPVCTVVFVCSKLYRRSHVPTLQCSTITMTRGLRKMPTLSSQTLLNWLRYISMTAWCTLRSSFHFVNRKSFVSWLNKIKRKIDNILLFSLGEALFCSTCFSCYFTTLEITSRSLYYEKY